MEKTRNSKHTRATAAQILGGIGNTSPRENGNFRVPSKWQSHHDALLEARAQILQHKGSHADIAKEEQNAFSLHMADAGTDEFDRDFALSLMSSEQNALYEIEQALTRIRNGTYGVCELTGEHIESERLSAVPWARFSAKAQRELEANGSVRRTQFARRGSLTASEPTGGDDDADEGESTPAASNP